MARILIRGGRVLDPGQGRDGAFDVLIEGGRIAAVGENLSAEGAEVLAHEAAWARSSGKPHRKLAAMSKLFACNTYRDTTAMAQQIWGGVGFTVEYDVQLYFRRAKALQVSWLDTHALEDRIASEVLV